jgi:hypothetical protein
MLRFAPDERWHALATYQLGMLSGHHLPLHNLTRAALEHFWANQRLATPGRRRFQSRSPTSNISPQALEEALILSQGHLMGFGVDGDQLQTRSLFLPAMFGLLLKEVWSFAP